MVIEKEICEWKKNCLEASHPKRNIPWIRNVQCQTNNVQWSSKKDVYGD